MQDEQAKKDKKAAKKEAINSAHETVSAPQASKTKLSFKEKYEFQTLEKEIENLEVEKARLEAELAVNATDFDIISKATERLGVVLAELSEKGDRWLELSEYAE